MNAKPASVSARCCVIGGAGFIGRALVKQLRETGRKVVIIDLGPAPISLPSGVSYHQGDYGDRAFLEGVLAPADEVIHLAYASIPKTSFEDPFADLLHNVPPALTLFEVAAKRKPKKVVLISSGGTVYGQAHTQPIPEDHPTNPISPYGITKLAIEKYAGLFHALQDLPVVIVRPANAYGEEQKPFTGQGFVATAIASILQNKPISVFGKTGGIRDYIHVEDIASGILAALEKGRAGEAYNLGTGVGTSNKEIINLLERYAQKANLSPVVTHQPDRKFDVSSNILNSAKIGKDTGWEASITLEKGLKKTWDYFLAHYE